MEYFKFQFNLIYYYVLQRIFIISLLWVNIYPNKRNARFMSINIKLFERKYTNQYVRDILELSAVI